jgi:hypothetical protein
MGLNDRQLPSLPGFLGRPSSDNSRPLYHTLYLEKPKTLSTIVASLTKLNIYKMPPTLSYPKKTIVILATLPNMMALTNSASSQPKIAILATLPNVMAFPNSVSYPTNEFEILNKMPTIDDTEGHLPLWKNYLAIIFAVIYESISISADIMCTLNKVVQDAEAY